MMSHINCKAFNTFTLSHEVQSTNHITLQNTSKKTADYSIGTEGIDIKSCASMTTVNTFTIFLVLVIFYFSNGILLPERSFNNCMPDGCKWCIFLTSRNVLNVACRLVHTTLTAPTPYSRKNIFLNLQVTPVLDIRI